MISPVGFMLSMDVVQNFSSDSLLAVMIVYKNYKPINMVSLNGEYIRAVKSNSFSVTFNHKKEALIEYSTITISLLYRYNKNTVNNCNGLNFAFIAEYICIVHIIPKQHYMLWR